jgi:hypothetical protein
LAEAHVGLGGWRHKADLGDRPVHLNTMSNEVEPVPLAKRVY